LSPHTLKDSVNAGSKAAFSGKCRALANALPVIFPEMIPRTPFCVTRAPRGLRRRELSTRALLVRFFLEGLLVGLELFFLLLGLVFLLLLLVVARVASTSALTNLATLVFRGSFSKKSVATCTTLMVLNPEAHAESEYHRNNNRFLQLGVLLDMKNIVALVKDLGVLAVGQGSDVVSASSSTSSSVRCGNRAFSQSHQFDFRANCFELLLETQASVFVGFFSMPYRFLRNNARTTSGCRTGPPGNLVGYVSARPGSVHFFIITLYFTVIAPFP